MARRTFTATTERIYARLPDTYRDADAVQTRPAAAPGDEAGYPLVRYLALVGDQLDELEDLVDRIDYRTADEDGVTGDTSDLVDPAAADAAWLPWLALLVGVQLNPFLSEQGRRDAIAGAGGGWQAGTRSAIASAAATALTGGRYVTVQPNPANAWQIIVTTQASETPGGGASVLAAIEAGHARPAGHELVHSYYAASWTLLEADYPTWGALEAAGSWGAIESNT